MTMTYKIFAINPGSTSTKVALFNGEECLFSKNIAHSADELKQFKDLSSQFEDRTEIILSELAAAGFGLDDVDAFVGRGGGLLSMEGGTYELDELVLEHARTCRNGVVHPACLGPQIAHALAEKYNKPAFVVNPPDTDEFCDLARMTGIKGVYRTCHLHALNLKETAIRHAHSIGKKYEQCNFIVCHLGGGVSVSAHCKGKMIDGNDIVGGDGPMAPTRCGTVPVISLLDYMQSSGADAKTVRTMCMKTGGFMSLCGTADARELTEKAKNGDQEAARAWNGFLYQTAKYIGEMAAVLCGQVDGILLGGGMVHNKDLVDYIDEHCGWIAPVYAYPGEFEMEAMAAGAIRVLDGEETAKHYSGVSAWSGF